MKDTSANINVFVSSTSEDLKDYRAVARNVILDIGWFPNMMEHFGTQPDTTVAACLGKVEQSDVVLLIVAFRRGWVPTQAEGGNGVDSVTAFELAQARERKKPVLALLASESWPGNLWEDDAEARAWIKTFRSKLNLPAVFFDYEADANLPAFRAKVKEALLAHKARLLAQKSAAASQHGGIDFLLRAREVILGGKDVPFIGMALYGSGPLSAAALAEAIAGDKLPQEIQSLATASEYLERYLGSREIFLEKFTQYLEAAVQGVDSVPVYDLLAEYDRAPLIVTASYDQLLEQHLRKAKRPFMVVTHILRSSNGVYDGKILLVREDQTTRICDADELDWQGEQLVIYRPLGAPLLHADLDPEAEIDTLVATETDHLVFLSRLQNQNTRVPDAFARFLQRRTLLFMGYPLDVWHFRLIMQVFQSIGAKGSASSILSVRIPDTTMEEIAWRRLGADLVLMDPNDFARSVLDENAA